MAELPYHLPKEGMTVGQLYGYLKRQLKDGELLPEMPIYVEAFVSDTPKQENNAPLTIRLLTDEIDDPYDQETVSLVLYAVKPGTDCFISADLLTEIP